MNNIFNKLAAPLLFLAGSVITAVTAPTLAVAVGGLGLSAAAMIYTDMALGGKDRFKLANGSAIIANFALTYNGLGMLATGIQTGNQNLAVAGGLLAVANSAFYGIANMGARLNLVSPALHSKMSSIAGGAIMLAGLKLNEPALAATGALFMSEAFARHPLDTPKPVPVRGGGAGGPP